MKLCPHCNTFSADDAVFCQACGQRFAPDANPPGQQQSQYSQTPQPPYIDPRTAPNNQAFMSNNAFDAVDASGKSRGVMALLAFFLGGLGVHYFYIGKNVAGILCIILTLCTCGAWSIVTFIQVIMLLCTTNQQFYNKFIASNSTFPIF